jgi:hypothetical protein
MAKKSNVAVAKTVEVTAFESLHIQCECDVKFAQEECDKWAAKFTADPAYAFEWAQGPMAQAARLSVNKFVLAVLDFEDGSMKEKTPRERVEVVCRELQQEVMRNAKWPSRSTSSVSNDMSLCMMSARADMLEKVEQCLKHNPN